MMARLGIEPLPTQCKKANNHVAVKLWIYSIWSLNSCIIFFHSRWMQCEPAALGSRVWYNVPGTWLDNAQCAREGMVIPNCGAEYGKGYIIPNCGVTELYCLSWSGTDWRDPAWPPTIWQNATTTDMFFVKMMTLLTIWSKTNQSKIVAFTTSRHSCNVLFIFRIGGQRPHMFTHVWLAGKGIAIIVYSPSRQVIVCHPPRAPEWFLYTYHSHLQSLPNKRLSKI